MVRAAPDTSGHLGATWALLRQKLQNWTLFVEQIAADKAAGVEEGACAVYIAMSSAEFVREVTGYGGVVVESTTMVLPFWFFFFLSRQLLGLSLKPGDPSIVNRVSGS